MESTIAQAHEDHAQHEEGHGHEAGCVCTVTIYVNNKEVHLHRGRYDVPTLKKLSGVPLADDLDELVGNKLKPVPDDATIHLEGCEVFISHPKDGGSS
jgi:hypothetical protein